VNFYGEMKKANADEEEEPLPEAEQETF